jgi:hypothetical protein
MSGWLDENLAERISINELMVGEVGMVFQRQKILIGWCIDKQEVFQKIHWVHDQ